MIYHPTTFDQELKKTPDVARLSIMFFNYYEKII